jgi:hypothetical protein
MRRRPRPVGALLHCWRVVGRAGGREARTTVCLLACEPLDNTPVGIGRCLRHQHHCQDSCRHVARTGRASTVPVTMAYCCCTPLHVWLPHRWSSMLWAAASSPSSATSCPSPLTSASRRSSSCRSQRHYCVSSGAQAEDLCPGSRRPHDGLRHARTGRCSARTDTATLCQWTGLSSAGQTVNHFTHRQLQLPQLPLIVVACFELLVP